MTPDETLRTNAEAKRDVAERSQSQLPHIDVVGRYVAGVAYEMTHQHERKPKRVPPPEPDD